MDKVARRPLLRGKRVCVRLCMRCYVALMDDIVYDDILGAICVCAMRASTVADASVAQVNITNACVYLYGLGHGGHM